MTPERFIAALSAHFSIRHDTEDQSARWLDDMLRALGGYSGDVLEKTSLSLIDERRQRSFPLIAEIREVADRYIPRVSDYDECSAYRVHRQKVEYASNLHRYELAKEWRDRVTASHGSVDDYLLATVGQRRDGALGRGMSASRRSSFKTAAAAITLPSVDRPAMEALQDAAIRTVDGHNRHTRELSARSKATMGESE